MLRGAKNAAPVKKCTNTWRADFTRPRHGQFPVNRQLETTSDPRQQVHDFARSTFVSTIVAPKLFPPPPLTSIAHTRTYTKHLSRAHSYFSTYIRDVCEIAVEMERARRRKFREETKQAPKRFREERGKIAARHHRISNSFFRDTRISAHSSSPTLHILISYRTQCSERERI